MLKGCVQLGVRPNVSNTINMVPVDHVAQIVVAASLHPPTEPLGVVHVTPVPRLSWTKFLESLDEFYYVKEVAYEEWRSMLIRYVEQGDKEEFAA